MYSRKIALGLARQIRRCPPHGMFKDPDRAAELAQHLAVCPHCAEAPHETLRLPATLPFEAEAPAGAAAGQIRYIRSEKAGWRQGYHCNPPMVVVLEIREEISDDILVAQIYDDTILAGPGDLILDGDCTGAGELFIETWNSYTLKAADLGTLMGQVPAPVVDAVRRMKADPGDAPPWAPLTVPMKEDDPRRHFRELEVETAFFFSSQAAGELMAELESPLPDVIYASLAEFMEAIAEKVHGIRFPWAPESLEDALASAEFPSHILPMAAADDRERIVIGKRVIFRDGQLAVYEPMEVAVFKTHRAAGGGIAFSGRFPVAPESRPVHAVFRYAASDGVLIEPAAEPRWDVETGAFYVAFDAPPGDWRELRAAVIYEAVQGEGGSTP